MENAELVHKLMCLMSGHRPQGHSDIKYNAIFVFGRAHMEWETGPGNEGILRTAADLFQKKVAPRIVIPGYVGNPDGEGGVISTAYPGWKRWEEKLASLDVPTTCIARTQGLGTNTKTEGDDFIFMSQPFWWRKAVVVTHPHQMLRAMLGLVKSMQTIDYWMNLLPVCPSQIDWTADTYGSQGAKRMPRHEHISEEWERIPRYQAQGDLATFMELSVYLHQALVDVYS